MCNKRKEPTFSVIFSYWLQIFDFAFFFLVTRFDLDFFIASCLNPVVYGYILYDNWHFMSVVILCVTNVTSCLIYVISFVTNNTSCLSVVTSCVTIVTSWLSVVTPCATISTSCFITITTTHGRRENSNYCHLWHTENSVVRFVPTIKAQFCIICKWLLVSCSHENR